MNTTHTNVARRWSLFPLRFVVGAGFLLHGFAKWNRGPEKFGVLLHQIGVPFPAAAAWMVTLLEIVGGLAILAGAFLVIACVPLIVTMVVAMFTVHWRYGFSAVNTIGLSPGGPILGPPGYEISLLYIGALVALCMARPSAMSVDGWRARAKLDGQ
jgi:putative oxidoreductase